MSLAIPRLDTGQPTIGDAARAFCAATLPAVSRTFALSIEALPDGLRDAVRAAYLLCRVVDTIEDEPGLAPERRAALFDAFDVLVRDDGADPAPFAAACARARLAEAAPEGTLCRGVEALFVVFRALPPEQRQLIRPHVLEMSSGMRATCARADASGGSLRLADVAELERYCYYVAGTVGELLTGLFAAAVPALPAGTRGELQARAVSFGIGLQLVNIVKDAAEDFERGACFLPRSLAERRGVALERLLAPAERPSSLAVVRDVCAVAREHLARAREYVLLWPVRDGEPPAHAAIAVRLFCSVPLGLALATLAEVEDGRDTLRPGVKPKIDRDTVASIAVEAFDAARSDAALDRLFERCLHGARRQAPGRSA